MTLVCVCSDPPARPGLRSGSLSAPGGGLRLWIRRTGGGDEPAPPPQGAAAGGGGGGEGGAVQEESPGAAGGLQTSARTSGR